MDLWDTWGFQVLVIGSLFFQIILILLGHRRKHTKGLIGIGLRCVLWVSYSMATVVVPYSLGKLTGLRVTEDTPFIEALIIALKVLIAPLLLLQLGYPDNITAYSMEDSQMGLRQVLNMTVVVTVVARILIPCYTVIGLKDLYIPLFLAGVVKYAEGVWALKFASRMNTGIASKGITEETMVPHFLEHLPEEVDGIDLLVKAYYRFNCLKPHIENWIYQPSYVSHDLLSIDHCSLKDAFIVTEMELGFMYDVLYTKAPVIYTKLGLIVRLVSFFCIVVTVCKFMVFKEFFALPGPLLGFLIQPRLTAYSIFTFSVLVLTLLLELYQILALPFSEWTIVKMANRIRWPLVFWFLRKLAPCSIHKRRRWSNSLDQLNMLRYCLCVQKDWTRYIKFLKFRGFYESIRKNWSLTRMGPVSLPNYLKERMMQELKFLNQARGADPFCERGKWTINRYNADELEWSIQMAFDKSIITWHLATNICYHLTNDQPDDSRSGSKLLSDYMMYLIVIHPDMLSTTGDIMFSYAFSEVDKILCYEGPVTTEEQLAKKIFIAQHRPGSSGSVTDQAAAVTSGWSVISDVQRLARSLMDKSDKWELISSVWMELLCCGALNCQLSHHADQLRRGGELITLVWLLLSHKTDRLKLKQ